MLTTTLIYWRSIHQDTRNRRPRAGEPGQSTREIEVFRRRTRRLAASGFRVALAPKAPVDHRPGGGD